MVTLSLCVVSRFLFLLLGPHGKGPQYHEIGRSMATLMTDEVRAGKIHLMTNVILVFLEVKMHAVLTFTCLNFRLCSEQCYLQRHLLTQSNIHHVDFPRRGVQSQRPNGSSLWDR